MRPLNSYSHIPAINLTISEVVLVAQTAVCNPKHGIGWWPAESPVVVVEGRQYPGHAVIGCCAASCKELSGLIPQGSGIPVSPVGGDETLLMGSRHCDHGASYVSHHLNPAGRSGLIPAGNRGYPTTSRTSPFEPMRHGRGRGRERFGCVALLVTMLPAEKRLRRSRRSLRPLPAQRASDGCRFRCAFRPRTD